MDILTRSQLRAERSLFEKAQSYGALSEAVSDSQKRGSRYGEITIFLSHKHGETEELKDAIAMLKRVNVSVYVDWMDVDMPKQTNGETAARLKKKIVECKKFILLATDAAIQSKWCNWELGLGDAAKYIRHLALLAVRDDARSWSGSEYLQIYPVIGRRYSWSDSSHDVQFPDGSTIDLEKWLMQ